jgi:hypothetical protein
MILILATAITSLNRVKLITIFGENMLVHNLVQSTEYLKVINPPGGQATQLNPEIYIILCLCYSVLLGDYRVIAT